MPPCWRAPRDGSLGRRRGTDVRLFEATPGPPPGPRRVLADLGPSTLANGILGLVFAASGPLAIVLSVGTASGLGPDALASWIFGIFFVNGLITFGMSWVYRQPLAFFWTIPGAVLVGPALKHLSLPEVVGAYLVTAVLILLVGATGWVRRAINAVPMPIVMAMVAGVFLRFGTDLVRGVHADPVLGAAMIGVFVALSALPSLSRRVPPLIGVLIVGAAVAWWLGRFGSTPAGTIEIARPALVTPAFSLPALIELVLPLAITVLVVQNGQGFAVLKAAGHEPPVNASTILCGVGSLLAAAVGAVSSCVTGPTNALLTSSGRVERQYTAGLVTGLLAILFGLLSPALTRIMLAAPREYVMLVAGLAMLKVLQAAFVTSFGGSSTLGALICFVYTVSDMPIYGIGAPFWGLLFGLSASRLLEGRSRAV